MIETINKIIQWLNNNTGLLQLLFSLVVTLSTVVYVFLTRRLVKETITLRKSETDPLISIILIPEERWVNLVDLVIKNIGNGPAYNISFVIDPDLNFYGEKKKKLSELNIFKGLKYLAPNQEIKFFLGTGNERYALYRLKRRRDL